MNKKISGRYRFLMQVDFRRKHFLKIQAVTYFLCFFLLCTMSIWIDNMAKIRQAEAAERYGSWHYGLIDASEEEIVLIEKNRLLKESGRAVVYGGIYSEDNYYLGDIGTLEESLLQLCGMKLLSGHLPQNENEIVLEQNTLEQLSIPYVLDREFTFKIQGAEDIVPQEFTYTLCGILQSYSTYTEAGSYLPMAVVTAEGAAAFSASGQQELFIQMVEGCDVRQVREELTKAISQGVSGISESTEKQWIQNAFVYGGDFRRGDTGGVRFFLSAIGYAVIFVLAFTCIFRERKRTDILRNLGMLDREILFLFMGEQILIWLTGMLLGLIFSRIGTGLLLGSYMRSRNLRTEISYPVSSIKMVCLISSVSLLAGAMSGLICARLKRADRRPREMDYRVLERGKLAPLSGDMRKALLRREFRVRRNAYIGLFCMQVLTFSAMAFCVAWIYQHYQGYVFNKRLYVCDYIIEHSPESGMPNNVDEGLLNRIRNMEGVEKVETVYWNSQVEIWDEEVRNGDYYQVIKDHYSNGESDLTSTLITLEAEYDLIEKWIAQVGEGKLDMEKFNEGEEVIIYLPLQILKDNRIENISYYKYLQNQEKYDAQYCVWQEKQIEVGDTLMIWMGEMQREVKIGGIIYDLIDSADVNRLMVFKPYDIYCGKGLFWQLVSEEANSSTYIYMEKGQTGVLMAEQMENMLNRSYVRWENIRNRVRPLLEYHQNGIFFGVALLVGFISFFVFILVSYLNREMEIADYKNRLLIDLGADFEKKERLYVYWYLRSMGFGVLTTLLVNSLLILLTTRVLGQVGGYYIVWLEEWRIYPLLLGVQLSLFVGEWILQGKIMKKKEKFSKNIYYFVS